MNRTSTCRWSGVCTPIHTWTTAVIKSLMHTLIDIPISNMYSPAFKLWTVWLSTADSLLLFVLCSRYISWLEDLTGETCFSADKPTTMHDLVPPGSSGQSEPCHHRTVAVRQLSKSQPSALQKSEPQMSLHHSHIVFNSYKKWWNLKRSHKNWTPLSISSTIYISNYYIFYKQLAQNHTVINWFNCL